MGLKWQAVIRIAGCFSIYLAITPSSSATPLLDSSLKSLGNIEDLSPDGIDEFLASLNRPPSPFSRADESGLASYHRFLVAEESPVATHDARSAQDWGKESRLRASSQAQSTVAHLYEYHPTYQTPSSAKRPTSMETEALPHPNKKLLIFQAQQPPPLGHAVANPLHPAPNTRPQYINLDSYSGVQSSKSERSEESSIEHFTSTASHPAASSSDTLCSVGLQTQLWAGGQVTPPTTLPGGLGSNPREMSDVSRLDPPPVPGWDHSVSQKPMGVGKVMSDSEEDLRVTRFWEHLKVYATRQLGTPLYRTENGMTLDQHARGFLIRHRANRKKSGEKMIRYHIAAAPLHLSLSQLFYRSRSFHGELTELIKEFERLPIRSDSDLLLLDTPKYLVKKEEYLIWIRDLTPIFHFTIQVFRKIFGPLKPLSEELLREEQIKAWDFLRWTWKDFWVDCHRVEKLQRTLYRDLREKFLAELNHNYRQNALIWCLLGLWSSVPGNNKELWKELAIEGRITDHARSFVYYTLYSFFDKENVPEKEKALKVDKDLEKVATNKLGLKL